MADQKKKLEQLYRTRRARLRQAVDQIGSQAEFARMTGKPANLISRLLGAKDLGEQLARELEVGAGLPPLFLDGEDNVPHVRGVREEPGVYRRPEVSDEAMRIARQIDRLPPAARKLVAQQVTGLAELVSKPGN